MFDNKLISRAYRSIIYTINTYIIDNQLVKERSSKKSYSDSEIKEKMNSFDDIAIQVGDKLDFYTTKEKETFILKMLPNYLSEKKAYDKGLFKIHTK